MKIKIRNELIVLNLAVLVLIIAIILLPSSGLRIALGLPFLLFFPGYTFMAALFPRRGKMAAIDRIALSFGMSIVIVPLVGLILNYSPWGIGLEPVLYSMSAFILITSIITWLRRRKLPEEDRFGVTFHVRRLGWGRSVPNRALSIVLVFTILGALGVVAYVVLSPGTEEKFTEFYVLDEAGKMAHYPKELSIDMAGNVILHIVNHEYREVPYRIEIRSSGVMIGEVVPVKLRHMQEWEQRVDFTPVSVGENQKVEFLLFKGGEDEPYQSLHIWLNVKNGE